jgi:WD40 repeat protein
MTRPNRQLSVSIWTNCVKVRLFISIFLFIPLFIALLDLTNSPTHINAQIPNGEDIIIPAPLPNNAAGTRLRGASNDGNRMVFESTNNYTGGNGDGNPEIYVYDKPLNLVIQITNTVDARDPSNAFFDVDNRDPAISGNGTQIVFSSNATSLDPANPNPNGNFEIYRAILPPGATNATIKRITNTGRNSADEPLRLNQTNSSPVTSDNGSTIAFFSTRQNFNAVNGIPSFVANNPERNIEIMVCNVTDSGGQCRQITVSNPDDRPNPFIPGGVNYGLTISGNGQWLAWISDFNYDPARLNNDANEEIFICNLGINSFRQVTQTLLSAPYVAVVPNCNSSTCTVDINAAISVLPINTRLFSSDGRFFVFESSGNLDGANSTRTRNLFVFDTTSGSLRRITNQIVSPTPTQGELRVVDYNFFPSINSSGTFITFNSTLNLTSQNPDGSREIFRYDINSGSFRQLTFTSPSPVFPDQRLNNTTSYLSSNGDIASFSYLTQSILPKAQTCSACSR